MMNMIQFCKDVLQALKLTTFENEQHLSSLLHMLTTPPMYTTLRFNSQKTQPEQAVEKIAVLLNEQSQLSQRKPYDIFLHPKLCDCIVIKNRGPFDVAKTDKEIIVDLACGMAILRGAHVYKNGIMGILHNTRAGDLVSVYADLDGKCLKGRASVYDGQKLHVGNGVSQVARSDVCNVNTSHSGIGILMTQPIFEAPSLADILQEEIFAQNLPSIVCVHVLDPQEGETILDMCAAPGGKTTHIATLMKNRGRIVALEKSKERTKKMEKLKTENMEIYPFDSTNAVSADADPMGGPPYPPCTFDRILVDAPCSALGQRPSYMNKLTLNQLKSFPVIQHKLLMTAVKLLKPGGVLVYSTCTITREENEDQVCNLLKACPDLDLVATPYKIGGDGLPGCGLSEEQRSMVQRFDPSFLSTSDQDKYNVDTIGFFIAKFKKNKDAGVS
ncbi:tRNA (cytosine(72)-C(5))-methyltransferase NSUN6-like [Physella acuta]|uniref:tRNA (cytosine(72)-C(5))-methyltransferase NSUN6-like n=1 Tax=Physella acuta TaxID=109671 RepID=UPI0027DE3754|nr:tRNA (cytosine(72)-C(5))-methyltransferase NSUN6-like [Physella acuta]